MNSTHAYGPGFDEFLDRLAPIISNTGYVAVVDSPGSDAVGLTVTHTVGLEQTFDHPELILIGFPAPMGAELICKLANRLTHRGDTLPLHKPLHDILKRHTVILKPAPIECARGFMPAAERWYQRKAQGFRALQVVWPDPNGRFPWESDYDARFAAHQQLLARLQ